MIKLLKFGLTLLLTVVFLYSTAQNNDCINGVALDSLKKEIVLKLTLAYFEDYKVDKNLSDIEQKGVTTYKELISKNVDSLNYPGDVISFLKLKANGWSRSGVTVFNGYYESMQKAQENNIFCKEDIYKPQKIKSTKYLDSTFSSLVERANSINMEAKQDNKQIKTAKNKSKNIIEHQRKEHITVASSEINYLTEWIYWIIIGVLLILIFVFYRTAKNSDYELSKLKRKYKELKSNNNFKINNLEQQLNQKSKEIKSVKDKNEELKSKSVSKDKPIIKEDENSIKAETKLQEPDIEIKKEIFLPAPYADAKINAEEGKQAKFDLALYKIELNKDEKSGSLRIVENEEMFELAFNSPDKYLEKACTYSNAREKHHKSIETIKSGKVILEGEDWLIKEKLTIKFI